MNEKINRRRFIKISAAVAGACLLTSTNVMAATIGNKLYRWHGRALGADAEMLLNISNDMDGDLLISQISVEISRMENIFSIYKANSTLSILNHTGHIKNAPIELIDLLSQADFISQITNGAFDVTVQPLWQLYNENKTHHISAILRQKISALVNYNNIIIDGDDIRFKKPGMAITLNGIAQGYITDKITKLLRSHGLDNSLIELGETRALGMHPNGRDWQVGLMNNNQSVALNNNALATSGGVNDSHVFHPNIAKYNMTANHRNISVIATTATLADGLSTAFSIMKQSDIIEISKKINNIEAIIIDGNNII